MSTTYFLSLPWVSLRGGRYRTVPEGLLRCAPVLTFRGLGGLNPRSPQVPHAHQVVGGTSEGEHPVLVPSQQFVLFFWLLLLIPLLAAAQTSNPSSSHPKTADASSAASIVSLQKVTAVRPLPHGIELQCGSAALRITALRQDILRIRVSRTGSFSLDHSWAVLPDMLAASVPVQAVSNPESVGFDTSVLQVRVERSPLRLILRNSAGRVLSEDYPGRPTTFYGNQFKVYKIATDDEHFYGLGDKAGSLDRRNRAFQMWNTDAYGWEESTDPLYKDIPFFLSLRKDGSSYGLFLDNTFRTSFDFTIELPDALSFGAQDGDLDYYFLYGPQPKQVLMRYADLVGHSPMLPKWAFGFQQSRWSYEPESRVREIVHLFRQKQIPLDVIYLDIDYQFKNRPFTIDTQKFSAFNRMVADLGGENVHVVAITDLHVAYLPGVGYAPYDSGLAGNHFLHNPDGSLFVGVVWPGPSVFPDFTRKSTREWWGNLYKDFYVNRGVAGFWNDMNEPSVFEQPGKTMPLDTVHRIEEPGQPSRSTSHREIHNVYGMQNSRGTYEGLLRLKPNLRPFVLTRASYAGGHRYAVTWTGDNASTWNHWRISSAELMNLGLSGFVFAGDDIGGFRGSPMPDLFTRWIELGAFNPIYRDHSEKGTADQEPWVHSSEQEAIRKRYIELRYQLMPYLYTIAEEASRTGVPMMRPLFLEFPKEEDRDFYPKLLDTEFLFGPALLVAPQMSEILDAYGVSFPKGGWYDYWTNQRLIDTSHVTIQPKLDVLPVFVRAGSIIPQQPVAQSTVETPTGPLQLRVYPGPHCQGSVYLDDGATFNFQRGGYLRENFSCQTLDSGIRIRIAPREGRFQPWWKQVQIQIAGVSQAPRQWKLNGVASDNASTEVKFGSLYLTVSDPPEGSEIEIQY